LDKGTLGLLQGRHRDYDVSADDNVSSDEEEEDEDSMDHPGNLSMFL
jgi:hypothetical protein